MNSEGKVVIITHQFSVVVKSMEKGLTERGYDVKLLQDDLAEIANTLASADAYVLYLQESILDDPAKLKKLFLICDNLRDYNHTLILIGSANSRDSFLGAVPPLKDHIWMDRPVEINALITEINRESNRIRADKTMKSILVIDDDPLYSQIIYEMLKDYYHVERASGGMQGITWLARNKVDLVLLDYEMPVADGPQILEMLRADPETASIPVMFLTGIATKESIARVMKFKPQGYILKTTGAHELLMTLVKFFEKQEQS